MLFSEPKIPQFGSHDVKPRDTLCFSALQRAENSSMHQKNARCARVETVSVLFSEPKIPQSSTFTNLSEMSYSVSVLFSEPKIPQFGETSASLHQRLRVSVLFSEPKIPQSQPASRWRWRVQVSVLFSEPKIPQSETCKLTIRLILVFQCSSASRKFLNLRPKAERRIEFLSFSALQRAENSSIAVFVRSFG